MCEGLKIMAMNAITEQIETLQNLLVSKATGGIESDTDYIRLRQVVLAQVVVDEHIPSFLKTNRNLAQFCQYIKNKFKTCAERKNFIWDEFRPLFDALEGNSLSAADAMVSDVINKFDSGYVQAMWSKALDRRTADPEGAITVARTLLESVCKHVLDEVGAPHDDNPDLTKLYRLVAEQLQLAPSQHTEQVFKQILGGCTAVVEGLGALRNRLSDAHGKGKTGTRPAPRHAELAVNLAGALAAYLLSTHEARRDTAT